MRRMSNRMSKQDARAMVRDAWPALDSAGDGVAHLACCHVDGVVLLRDIPAKPAHCAGSGDKVRVPAIDVAGHHVIWPRQAA